MIESEKMFVYGFFSPSPLPRLSQPAVMHKTANIHTKESELIHRECTYIPLTVTRAVHQLINVTKKKVQLLIIIGTNNTTLLLLASSPASEQPSYNIAPI
jgi:hypothetical protein